jgi:SNF2 family DNA or RNA helicase
MTAPPLFAHQAKDVEFYKTSPLVFNASDPGTGKTRVCIEAIKSDPPGSRALVICPKSIMIPAWGNDILKFAPELTFAVAAAPKRAAAFDSDALIVITNHDATTWLCENSHKLTGFHRLIVDESTAFKNQEAKRSKALYQIAAMFEHRTLLSGTPTPNGILDIWHQILILDRGQRLGQQFYRFRAATCSPRHTMTRRVMDKRTGMMKTVDIQEWEDKEGAVDAVSALLADITIRNKMEECISIPPNHTYTVDFELSPAHRRQYLQLEQTATVELKSGDVKPFDVGALTTKLLQLASGAVYSGDSYLPIDNDRYELVLDLAEARSQCVIAFNWRHQLEGLKAEATKRKIPFAVIDGTVKTDLRTKAVNDFQAGAIRIIFAHPQSAGHGLTLTKGVATIWASPTYNLEHFEQFNHRIYRAGQTQPTETILIQATNTLEAKVYEALQTKQTSMLDLLTLLQS